MDDLVAHLSALHCKQDGEELCSALNIRWKQDGAVFNKTFSSLTAAITAVKSIDTNDDVAAIWVNLHQLPNEYEGNTNNDVVIQRTSVLIDLDPDRPNQSNSTEAEKKASYTAALELIKTLSSLGFPEPSLFVDSGNGHHLYYWLDDNFPLSSSSDHLIKELLKCLSVYFPTAGVDKNVHDRARIVKLAGTVARKGPHSEERPWRRAKILARNKTESVSDDLIKRVITTLSGKACAPDKSDILHSSDIVMHLEVPPETKLNKAILSSMLSFISADCDRSNWRTIVWAIASLNWISGKALAQSWSMECMRLYKEDDFERVWNDFDPTKGITYRSLVYFAKKEGYSDISFLTGELAKAFDMES